MATQYIQPTDEQIRTRAYYLWEKDGCPHGSDQHYWHCAKQQLEQEISGSNGSSRKTAPSASPEKTPKRTASRTPVFA